jgi:hypothetical protein
MSSPELTCPSYEQLVKRWRLYEHAVPGKGRGVFTGTSIPAHQLVLKFQGPVFDRDTCPNFAEAIQVGSEVALLSIRLTLCSVAANVDQ